MQKSISGFPGVLYVTTLISEPPWSAPAEHTRGGGTTEVGLRETSLELGLQNCL